MIEKIIIQDSSEVHSFWIPERRSLASFIVWKAYGLGSGAGWTDGQISLGAPTEWVDWPAYPEFPGYMDEDSIPAWVDEYLAAVDASLPALEGVLAAMDADSLTVMLDPPAFRVPLSPADQDLATCILASRLLLAARHALVTPTGVTAANMAEQVSFASRFAALVGKDSGRRLALEAAASPELCYIIPDSAAAEDAISTERADD